MGDDRRSATPPLPPSNIDVRDTVLWPTPREGLVSVDSRIIMVRLDTIVRYIQKLDERVDRLLDAQEQARSTVRKTLKEVVAMEQAGKGTNTKLD